MTLMLKAYFENSNTSVSGILYAHEGNIRYKYLLILAEEIVSFNAFTSLLLKTTH